MADIEKITHQEGEHPCSNSSLVCSRALRWRSMSGRCGRTKNCSCICVSVRDKMQMEMNSLQAPVGENQRVLLL